MKIDDAMRTIRDLKEAQIADCLSAMEADNDDSPDPRARRAAIYDALHDVLYQRHVCEQLRIDYTKLADVRRAQLYAAYLVGRRER